ncbi:MAG: toprim domain-containing protein [Terrimicrobiaceae bacterium]
MSALPTPTSEILPTPSPLIDQHDPDHLAAQSAQGYTPFPDWLTPTSIRDRIVNGQDRGGRDGVQTETLIENGIHRPTTAEINDFFDSKWPDGFIIPYHDALGGDIIDNDRPYARIRISAPGDGPKYLQSKGSKPHIYIPRGLSGLNTDELVVVEGEIKALSLVEEGIAAVGIGGFYGLASNNILIPEIIDALINRSIKKVYFLGDNDTSVNPQFSDAAIKYSHLLNLINPASPISLYLPRIPLDKPKGIDDVKGALGASFRAFWDSIIKTAIHVPPFIDRLGSQEFKDKRAELILLLLTPVIPFIASSSGAVDAEFFYRFASIYNYLPLTYRAAFASICRDVMYEIKDIDTCSKLLPWRATKELQRASKSVIMAMYGGKSSPVTALPPAASLPPAAPSSPSVVAVKASKPKVHLPSAPFTTPADTAREIFDCLARTKKFFFYNSAPAYVQNDEKLEFLGPDSLRHEVPNYAEWVKIKRSKLGFPIEKVVTYPSADECKIILQTHSTSLLPPLHCIHKSPILVKDGTSLKALTKGYNPEAGGRYIVNGGVTMPVHLGDAVNELKELISDSPFNSESDRSRALCALITPALIFGDFFPSHSPLFFFEADFSQIGKGFLAELIQTIYGEQASIIGQQTGGVGSVDETLAAALVKGTPFIQMDNFRGTFSAPYFEAILTTGKNQTVSCRTPYAKAVDVDPKHRVFHFTSNGITTTTDLLNRMCVIRLRQANLPKTFKTYSGNLEVLDYIAANQAKCLGAVFRIVQEWASLDRPRRPLPGNSRFQLWWEVMEWFAVNIFGTVSPREDHDEVRQRIAIPDLSWLRQVAIAACEKGPAKDLTAQKISDICQRNVILAPTARGQSSVDRLLAGRMLNRIFNDSEDEEQVSAVKLDEPQTIEIDGYSVTRVKRMVERPLKGDQRPVVFYSFEFDPSKAPPAASAPTGPQVPPVIPTPAGAVGKFDRISEDIKLLVAEMAKTGPDFDTLIVSLSKHGISPDLAERAILTMIDSGSLFHLEGRFFAKDPDGYPVLSAENMHLAPKIQEANPVHMASLAHWQAFQLWTEGRLPASHRQPLLRFVAEVVDDPDEWTMEESGEEECSKAGMELHMKEEK